MLNHQKALDYFQNLYLTAMADRKLVKEENTFLVQVAQQLGISSREAADIMMRGDNLDLKIPMDETERLSQLEDIVMMMMVDGKIHEKEYELCLRYARAIGKGKNLLDEIIMQTIKAS